MSSAAAPGQLVNRKGEPLAQIIDAPNRGHTDPPTLPLLCLTDAGRVHYSSEHWAAYAALYPEVAGPELSRATASARS